MLHLTLSNVSFYGFLLGSNIRKRSSAAFRRFYFYGPEVYWWRAWKVMAWSVRAWKVKAWSVRAWMTNIL